MPRISSVAYLPPFGTEFPPVEDATADGVVAVGGVLSQERLVSAYAHGIFPWYDDSSPILWWSPDPRCVLYPQKFHVPRSLRRVLNAPDYTVTLDTAFGEVMQACGAAKRPEQDGTWIIPEMVQAYTGLHRAGFAHSVEVRNADGKLTGGLYGVAIGTVFFGESMFFCVPNASKLALVWLVALLQHWGYTLIDCQQETAHLLRFGAECISRDAFLKELYGARTVPASPTAWQMPNGFFPC